MTMKTKLIAPLISAAACMTLSLPAQAKFETGQALPDMQVVDSNGVTHNLSDFDGKNIVLEWTNHDCPYVRKHYSLDYKNMQGLQKQAAADDVVWLSIISSAVGEQGYVEGAEANALTLSRDAAPMAVVLDPNGAAGRAFSAQTTPHMFVINKDRELVYQGAIDSKRSSRPSDIPNSKNYVAAALNALKTGTKLEKTETTPYGCSVKYAKKEASAQQTSYVKYAQSSYGSGHKKQTTQSQSGSQFKVKSREEIARMSPQDRAKYQRELVAYKKAQKQTKPKKAYGS